MKRFLLATSLASLALSGFFSPNTGAQTTSLDYKITPNDTIDRSFAEVGAALRVAPDAARMRVNRALEKLRETLERRGIKTTANALGAALLAKSVQAAPGAATSRILRALPTPAPAASTSILWSKGILLGSALATAVTLMLFLYWSGKRPARVDLTFPAANLQSPERAVPEPDRSAWDRVEVYSPRER